MDAAPYSAACHGHWIHMLTALWCRDLQAAEYRPLLTTLFSRYVDVCLEHCRRNFKTVVPLVAVNQVGLHGVGS